MFEQSTLTCDVENVELDGEIVDLDVEIDVQDIENADLDVEITRLPFIWFGNNSTKHEMYKQRLHKRAELKLTFASAS